MPAESCFTPASDWCRHPEWWHAADGGAAEEEVGNLLAGLVRVLQPGLVVETGSYRGDTARAIGYALRTNGHGRLVTIEQDEERARVTAGRVRGLPVTVEHGSSLGWMPPTLVDLLFLDSDIGIRPREVEHFRPHLAIGAVIVVHDTAPHHLNREQVRALTGDWPALNLRTPRGLLVFQQPG